MPRCTRLEKSAYVLLILLAVVFMGAVTRDAWRMIGRPWTGFPVMENLVVGVGGRQRTAAEPFDLVRAVNGHLVSSSRELQKEIERYPAGTRLRYLLVRGGSLVEEEIAGREMTLRTFKHFVVDNLVPGILVLGLGGHRRPHRDLLDGRAGRAARRSRQHGAHRLDAAHPSAGARAARRLRHRLPRAR